MPMRDDPETNLQRQLKAALDKALDNLVEGAMTNCRLDKECAETEESIRERLLVLGEQLLSISHDDDHARAGTLFGFDMDQGDIEPARRRITKAIEDIRKFNNTKALKSRDILEGFPSIEELPIRHEVDPDSPHDIPDSRLFDFLPAIMEAYLVHLQRYVEGCKQHQFRNRLRDANKAALLRCVRGSEAGKAHYNRIILFLEQLAEFRGVNLPVDDDRYEFTYDALRQFDRRHPVPEEPRHFSPFLPSVEEDGATASGHPVRLETKPRRGVRHRNRRKPPATATPFAYRHRASRRLYPPCRTRPL